MEATTWGTQFEGPQEVVGLLEVCSTLDDLVDDVLDAIGANCSQDAAPTVATAAVPGTCDGTGVLGWTPERRAITGMVPVALE